MPSEKKSLDQLLDALREERLALAARLAERDKRERPNTAAGLSEEWSDLLSLEGAERRITEAEREKSAQTKQADSRKAFGDFLDNLLDSTAEESNTHTTTEGA